MPLAPTPPKAVAHSGLHHHIVSRPRPSSWWSTCCCWASSPPNRYSANGLGPADLLAGQRSSSTSTERAEQFFGHQWIIAVIHANHGGGDASLLTADFAGSDAPIRSGGLQQLLQPIELAFIDDLPKLIRVGGSAPYICSPPPSPSAALNAGGGTSRWSGRCRSARH